LKRYFPSNSKTEGVAMIFYFMAFSLIRTKDGFAFTYPTML
jgi:hypothetical protein